jgi:hypothetical protein
MKLPFLVTGLVAGLAISTQLSIAQNKGQNPPVTNPPGSGSTAGNTRSGSTSIPTNPGGANIPGGTNIPGNRTPTGPGSIPSRLPGSTEPTIPMPVFLSGKVVLSDGTPPPDSVVIERLCGGRRWPEAYTDSKGHFSFEVGRNARVMPDASVSFWEGAQPVSSTGGLSDHPLAGCELRASLPGYESSVVDLSARRRLDSPDVGTIVLRRLAAVEGSTISVTSLEASKDARKAYEKGVQALKKEKWQDAQKNLQKAVELYPRYAAAWYELGRAYNGLGDTGQARECYGKALAADGKFLKPYLEIADLAMKEKNWKELAEKTGLLIKLDPVDYPGAYLYNSFAYYSMNNLDAAEKSAREGIRIDSGHSVPKMEHILGVILASKRDYAGAAAFLKSYLEHAPGASDAETVRKQLAEVERIAAVANQQQR